MLLPTPCGMTFPFLAFTHPPTPVFLLFHTRRVTKKLRVVKGSKVWLKFNYNPSYNPEPNRISSHMLFPSMKSISSNIFQPSARKAFTSCTHSQFYVIHLIIYLLTCRRRRVANLYSYCTRLLWAIDRIMWDKLLGNRFLVRTSWVAYSGIGPSCRPGITVKM